MSSGPLLRSCNRSWFILLPSFRDIGCQRIIRVRCAKQSLNREENGSYLKGRGPVALQDIQTDAAKLIDVGMVDLGQESDLGWGHRIIIWEEELELEDTALIWGLAGTMYRDVEVSEVVFVGNCADAWDWFCHQPLRLLDDALW